MADVVFERASRRYSGLDHASVDQLDLRVDDGEFLVIVGPSGSGKSTTLRMLAGLEPVDSGRISIGPLDVTTLPPKARDIAMVFQNYALYPNMTVAQNMAFALKIAGVGRQERNAKVLDTARRLELEPYLNRKPGSLSGGQRQRVAMGRAIVREPQVFLMDEPLSNLDAKLRVQTRSEVAALQRRLAVTTLYVTHDQTEALTMGDRIAVLNEGRLQQVGTPRELYDEPANTFVAGFIGSPAMNVLTLAVDGGAADFGGSRIDVPRGVGRSITVGIRPEDLQLAAEGGLPMTVELVEELGADAFVYGQAALGGEPHRLVLRADGRVHPALGELVRVVPVPGGRLHLFDAQSGERVAA